MAWPSKFALNTTIKKKNENQSCWCTDLKHLNQALFLLHYYKNSPPPPPSHFKILDPRLYLHLVRKGYRVKLVPFVFISPMIKRPLGSELGLLTCKSKLLLKSMHVPALLLEQQLKRALYPHSAVHGWTLFSCNVLLGACKLNFFSFASWRFFSFRDLLRSKS